MNYTTVQTNLPLVKESTDQIVKSPADVSRICEDMKSLAQESFHVITINTKNKMINRHMITLGIVDCCLAHPREVFRPAILDGASGIICVHNHPSGDSCPSCEDIRITKQLIQAGKTLEIKVFDHIIIGKEPLSMRDSGLADFS